MEIYSKTIQPPKAQRIQPHIHLETNVPLLKERGNTFKFRNSLKDYFASYSELITGPLEQTDSKWIDSHKSSLCVIIACLCFREASHIHYVHQKRHMFVSLETSTPKVCKELVVFFFVNG